MAEVIEVDLLKTGGRLIPPGDEAPPAAAPRPAQPPPTPADDRPAPLKACKCCGWPEALDPAAPAEGDAEEFLKAVLRGEPFRRRAYLFSGAVPLTFKDLTADEEEAVKTQVVREVARGDITTFEASALRHTALRLVFAVESVTAGEQTYRAPGGDPFAVDLAAESARLRGVFRHAGVYDALKLEFHKFYGVLMTLQNRAADASFWKATPAAGSSPDSPSKATRA